MQQPQLAVLNFALAVIGLFHTADWYATRQSHLLQWVRLEARLAHDNEQPELLALAREQRMTLQQPLTPFYATYSLIFVVIIALRLISGGSSDSAVFLRDLSGGALYALCAAAIHAAIAYCLPVLSGGAAWAFTCVVLAVVMATPLSQFHERARQREAAGQ